MVNVSQLQDIANILRRDVAIMTNHSGSGHPTSCFSCAEIISCLFFEKMSYDVKNPFNLDNDEFVLSKGHAAPILYSALYRAKAVNFNLNTLRELKSSLEGHPLPRSMPWIKTATGSLGQGLSVGAGMALAAKLSKKEYQTYVLLGDSELAEGNIWEAFQIASHYQLNNLCAIIDVNGLGQRGKTMLENNLKSYKERIVSFGWNAIVINGHNIPQILSALENSKKSNKPTAIIAQTIKGRGVSFLENKEGWHGKVLDDRQLHKCLDELPHCHMPKINIKYPKKIINKKIINKSVKQIKYNFEEEVSTREAYGKALANLALSNQNILAIDAEVSNSTYASEVKKLTKEQFIEAYIAEQNMISMSLGLSKKGLGVFASSFAAFLTRTYDQLRMASYSDANFSVCGSHSGVSIGQDGASQMGLQDIAMFRTLPNSIIFYPSDAVSCNKLVNLCSNLDGIKYIRTTRNKTKVIYNNNESFLLGEFKIVKQSNEDKAVLIGSGITLHECIKAYNELKNKKIKTAVVDIYCIKPFKKEKFISFVKKHGNKIILTEDHYQEGGIGEMILEAIKNTDIKTSLLNVKGIPHSGNTEELLSKYRIDKKAILEEFNKIL